MKGVIGAKLNESDEEVILVILNRDCPQESLGARHAGQDRIEKTVGSYFGLGPRN